MTSLAGKELAQLSLNPPLLAERVADTSKQISELQTILPSLQQQLSVSDERVNSEKLASAAKVKASAEAIEAASGAQQQMAQKVSEAKAELDKLQKDQTNADEATRPFIQQKLEAQTGLLAAVETALAKARELLKQKQTEADATKVAEAKLNSQISELTKEVEKRNAEVDRVRQGLSQQKEGTPGFNDVNTKLAARTAEAAQAQNTLRTLQKQAGQVPTDNEEAVAKAKSALEATNQQLADARTRLGRWKLAQLFQTVHLARESLAQRQATYDELVATINDALLPIAGIKASLAEADKTAAETANKFVEEGKASRGNSSVDNTNQRSGRCSEAVVVEREKSLKAAIDAVTQANTESVDQLTRQLAAQNAEATKLQEGRAKNAPESQEFRDADKLVHTKDAEIAATTTALDKAKKDPKAADSEEAKAALVELTQAREVLEKNRAAARDATDKLAAADRDFKKAKGAAEQASKQLAELKAREPAVVSAAQASKLEAERALPGAEKELAAAKTQAEKTRVDYEAAKGNRSASIAAPVSRS